MATDLALERRRRLTHRALPALAVLAAGSLAAGIGVGSAFESLQERVGREYARAWDAGDMASMHRLLSPEARSRFSVETFEAAHDRAEAVATATEVRAGEPSGTEDGTVRVPVTVTTRVFRSIRGEVRLPVGDDDTVEWAPHLVFPGLEPGETLSRREEVPRRGRILSVEGRVLAQGPADARTSPTDGVGTSIAGSMEASEDAEERRALFARGFPEDMPVGASGLERALQEQVEGRPGGILLAGGRVAARARPQPAGPVRSTIDTDLQAAADLALAGRFGGVAALDARTAEVRALSGVAFSAPQPPGSTFKIITTTAALDHRLVRPSDEFPVETQAIIDGVPLQNANGESCGGSFRASFAHSCNSVFAPLGVKVGARRLVAAAERYGWNEEPTLAGAMPSTLPSPRGIVSPLDLGSTAIGQGKVLATPLQMASVSQTIANHGMRIAPTLLPSSRARRTRVTSRRTARTIARLMVDVVGYGTGTAASIPGVRVAGKTGTAELEDTRGPEGAVSDPSNTDAWFTSYAPARRPKIAVAVLLVRNGSGGATAAPAARVVLGAALGK